MSDHNLFLCTSLNNLIISFQFFAGTTIQFLQGIVRRRIWICGIAICLCYQLFLSYFGLKDFIQNGSVGDGSRSNLIDANREGLTSCIGYTGLFIIASFMGSLIFHARYSFSLLCMINLHVCYFCFP